MPAAEADRLADRLADHTAGLRLIQLASIVTSEAPQALSEQQRRSRIVGLL
jgi:hypothetical protein